jgi:hypothetical protein
MDAPMTCSGAIRTRASLDTCRKTRSLAAVTGRVEMPAEPGSRLPHFPMEPF